MSFLKNTKVIGIVFYVFGLLYLIYTIFIGVNSAMYLSSVMGSDYYATITVSDIISAYIGQVGPYLFYTLVLLAAGYIIQTIGGQYETQAQELAERNSRMLNDIEEIIRRNERLSEAGEGDFSGEPYSDQETLYSDYTDEPTADLDLDVSSETDNGETDLNSTEIEERIANAITDASANSEVDELETIQEEQKEEE